MTTLGDSEVGMEQSAHLEGYINYYKGLEDPGYAVLVIGSWGSGKTHQVQNILDDSEYHYVSIFGAQSTEEIYSSVYAKMFPAKAFSRELASSADGLGLGPVTLGGLVSSIANAFLKEQVDSSRILVFDDLERSRVPINDLLSVFNKYVEHHKCRVIVLAHDEKIVEDLKHTKEKVFGQTIKVIPQYSSAFDSFVRRVCDSKSRDMLSSFKNTMLEIFVQSGTHSLRILKHSIEDISRLVRLLSNNHIAHDVAMSELIRLFLALSLEVRFGRLGESDLVDRKGALIRYSFGTSKNAVPSPVPAIALANHRYPSIDLGSTLLSDQDLIDLLIWGNYKPEAIHRSLANTPYFTNIEELPAWLVFMNFEIISEADSYRAAEKLKDEFLNRSVVNPGEILHLFALRFLFSELEIIPDNYDRVESDCELYLDELLAKNAIAPYVGAERQWGTDYKRSFNGYSYWLEPEYEEHFARLVGRLKDTQIKAAVSSYSTLTRELLQLLSSDGKLFATKISPTFSGDNIYASVPILDRIEPSDFVQEWMGSPAHNWRDIARGLEQRYSGGELAGTLSVEKNWLRQVISLLERQSSQSHSIRRKRIQRILTVSLKSLAVE